jgi:hypothetical protein
VLGAPDGSVRPRLPTQIIRKDAGFRGAAILLASTCDRDKHDTVNDMKTALRIKSLSLPLAFSLVLLALLAAAQSPAAELVPLKLKLPAPMYTGTPQDLVVGPDVEPLSDKPRPALMVPADVKNLAPGSKVTCGDTNANARALAKITDGNKNASDSSILLLRKGTQFVQFDLGNPNELFAIVIWHAHDAPKVYRDVVVQVADDVAFGQNVRTLFNNDKDNSSGRGAGTDREYFETHEGKLVDAKGVTARCVRLYSRGNTESVLNEYIEVEIYGRPVK